MLIDAINEGPPSDIIKKIEELQQDSVAEVRSSAKAVIKKIDRLAG